VKGLTSFHQPPLRSVFSALAPVAANVREQADMEEEGRVESTSTSTHAHPLGTTHKYTLLLAPAAHTSSLLRSWRGLRTASDNRAAEALEGAVLVERYDADSRTDVDEEAIPGALLYGW